MHTPPLVSHQHVRRSHTWACTGTGTGPGNFVLGPGQ